MKVFIVTEGGGNIGFGHITRCTALYQSFQRHNITPKFIVNGDAKTEDLLKGKKAEIINWLDDEKALFSGVRDADIVIVDSYLAKDNFYRRVSKLARVACYLDGDRTFNYPPCVVVRGNLYAREPKASCEQDIVYLSGPKYIMLREEFWSVPEKRINRDVKSLLITFGASDIRDLTVKVMAFLNENYPELEKKIIVGKAFRSIKEIEALKDAGTSLIYYPDAEDMKKIMLESDIAISAGGQTLYELARVGVPAVGICVAPNQRRNLESWQKAGFLEYAGWYNDNEVLTRLNNALKRLSIYKERVKRFAAGRGIIDGKGQDRICEALLAKARVSNQMVV